MKVKMNRLQELIPAFLKISQISFWLALFVELTIVIVEKSEYVIRYESWWFRLTFLLCAISLITVKHSKKEWLYLLLFGVLGFISYKITGKNELIRWVVFVFACKGKDMKRVFQFSFWYMAAGSILLILLSVFGIFGSIYQTGVFRYEMEETRYCFGMGHPNSFHCMMLVITWLGIYCYHEKLKWWGYGLISLAHGILFYFSVSRTGLLMSVGTLLAVIAVKYVPKLKEGVLPYVLGIGTISGAVFFSVFMAKNSIYHPFLAKLDVYLSGRIVDLINTMDSEGMLHTWSLWSVSENSYYFDLGIVRMFYWFGIIPATIYFLLQCKLVWCGYQKRDYMMAVIMICITIYSIFEAHFISVYLGRNFILFWFGMYLTQMLGEEKDGIYSVNKCNRTGI